MNIGRLVRWYGRVPYRIWVKRKLGVQAGYCFTADHVSRHFENWNRLLGGLAGLPGIRILEIGSFEGRSAVWFLEHILTDPSARLFCLDLFREDRYDVRFDHNIRCSGAARKVTKLTGQSVSLLEGLEAESFDAVYVDGSHQAVDVLWDAFASWRLLKEGGLLIFDDYLWGPERPEWDRPQMAVDRFLEFVDGDCEVLLHDYQVAVRKRTAAATGLGGDQ